MAFNARSLNEIPKLQFINYSKNPHKKTSGLRTLRQKCGQQKYHIPPPPNIHVTHKYKFSLTNEKMLLV